ncbi:MAG: hypothetical protein NC420_12970 [Eubacterium sp.]|nr:hypothetical protein [Eubacterium sp.]MCM1215715.1 hypothetical protein [Lachnospiraceae bacterium]MCM1304394.1 hypothetical protein [Butyrivibrio sp.]MCM1343814.1 hypothetical protein [Muribaculaceae bacterium]MCM1238279.1 hypothetical protein [Lachnospiraceae bacterium]
MEDFGMLEQYHIPKVCKECGGVMIFKGVGEYHCEMCGEVDYDDYGKVRLYIEKHPGANAAQVEDNTGVSQKIIRRLLKDGRIEVAEGSKSFLRCEVCGKSIRSGQFCPECEKKVHHRIEEQQRSLNQKRDKFVAMGQKGDEGQRRFMRRE